MCIRDRGYIAAKGALNFVDGAYIEPFAFSLGNGSGDFSFVIDRRSTFFILDCLFMDSVSDVQNFLVESGCQQLRLSSLNS